jgi:hypothetical protein
MFGTTAGLDVGGRPPVLLSILAVTDRLTADFRPLGGALVLATLIDAQRSCEGLAVPYPDFLTAVEALARQTLADLQLGPPPDEPAALVPA